MEQGAIGTSPSGIRRENPPGGRTGQASVALLSSLVLLYGERKREVQGWRERVLGNIRRPSVQTMEESYLVVTQVRFRDAVQCQMLFYPLSTAHFPDCL